MDQIDAILEWAEVNPWFNATFVESVRDWRDSGNDVSGSQSTAIENIFIKCKVQQWVDRQA